jgi:tetratricopeptide (TPR) repeat protein
MAFFRRLFGARDADGYAQGIKLFEAGRAAESLELLRPVFRQDPGSPRGSLAGFYLRQALASEGRRLLAAGDAVGAATHFGEAAEHWPDFPDLQFFAGCAWGLGGDWDRALGAAQRALRRNMDYCEARLLEACALQSLQRPREARASLEQLIESGRRVDHQLVRDLAPALATAADLPGDLIERLRRAALGDDVKQQLAGAVALCQAGRLDEGLAAFARLAEQHERYPDVHAKHAAALYQAGRDTGALEAAETALAINSRYRTAVSLKGLILAEQGRVASAREFLAASVPRLEGTAGRHEELFLAYLVAVLDLLSGRRDECRRGLEPWNDLPRHFARAELLLVACDHLAGQTGAALRRLETLGEIWTADGELAFLRVALLIEDGEWAAADELLARWPGGRQERDERPLLLRCRLDLARGRQPTATPAPALAESAESAHPADPADPDAGQTVAAPAWRQIEAATRLRAGDASEAWDLLTEQLESGHADEETGRLLLAAAAAAGQRPPADLAGRIGAPDSWAEVLCGPLRAADHGAEAEALVTRRRSVRPELLIWSWLSAGFWLDPVRRWLA